MDSLIEHAKCTHWRARVGFDPRGGSLHDDKSPLVVRLDDRGHTTVMSGWKGHFDVNPIGHAWNHFGDMHRVCTYLAMIEGVRAVFVGVPGARTFAFMVISHPDFVATFGGEGEESPGEGWVSQVLAQRVKEVTAFAEGEAWAFALDELVTGTLTRTFNNGSRAGDTLALDFEEWEDGEVVEGGYLDYDYAMCEARNYLAGHVLDCKRCKRGA